MTIHFYLRYRSSYGQTFFVCGNIPELGNDLQMNAIELQYLNEDFWHGVVEVADETVSFRYKYILHNNDGSIQAEWIMDRGANLQKIGDHELQLLDTWNYTGEYENAFYTQPFRATLLNAPKTNSPIGSLQEASHIFKVKAPLLQADEVVCILGNHVLLNNWDETKPILLGTDGSWFSVGLNLSDASFPITYKYGIYNVKSQTFVNFENGDNRVLYGIGRRQKTILHDGFIHLPNNTFKGAGIAIPVFSLRSQSSLGVGEFTDVAGLADWAKKIGMKLIQLLPINDTTATHTFTDSYPYAPISVFALHPIYINLAALAGEKHVEIIAEAMEQQATLNALPEVDYVSIMALKMQSLKALYAVMKADWLSDPAYATYFDQNKHWLVSYAAFCHLRDQFETADFTNWGTHVNYNAAFFTAQALPSASNFDDLGIHFFIQYYLHVQLKAAVNYTHSQGIILKGDLPIGIYRNSADAWVAPDLYNMNAQAGAPPDDFAIKGQNWGFPTYNWKKMQADGFSWWKLRFEQMSLYFDAFRIDHILGFFRIWSIPMDAVQGLLGHFVPAIPVTANEFSEKGIWFDHDRYCRPFINDNVLLEMFGDKTNWAKITFFNNNGWGSYTLKPEVETQRKADKWFDGAPDHEGWAKEKIFDLISNVLLIEDTEQPGTGKYHFRIGMEGTISFKYLDQYTQGQLKALYVNYFFRRQDDFWRKQAMQKLPALKEATQMLICGEDLGMVPDCVPGVMKDTGLLSLEIQRMPKDPKKKFFHPNDAPYMSVVTPSTHDMSTIRGWWEENTDNTRLFFKNELGQLGDAPFYCEPWINRAIITQHLYCPAMWSIFQLQDLLGSDAKLRRENPHDERINIPADPKHYWRYRMHLSIEALNDSTEFNNDLQLLIKGSGRS